LNGQVKATVTAPANGSGPERTSPEESDEVVVVEDGAGEAVVVEAAS